MHRFGQATLVATLFLAACSRSIEGAPVTEPATFAPSLNVDLATATRLASGMYTKDLVVGTGAAVQTGQTLSMRYAGWLSNGTPFDATGNRAPFQFVLGAGQVIAGWDQGVAGMKVGGKRQLIIPPTLGYGAAGVGPIPGNSILVFTVEVVAAQ